MTDIISPLPFTLVNGQVADASQVMANLNEIRNDVNAFAPNISSGTLIRNITATNVAADGVLFTLPARSLIFALSSAAISGVVSGSFKISTTIYPTGISWDSVTNPAIFSIGYPYFYFSDSTQTVNISVPIGSWNSSVYNITFFYIIV